MAADHELDLQSVSETMFRSNEEDIKSRFAILLTSVKSALEANHVATNDVRTVLVGMFTSRVVTITYQTLT